MAESVCIWGQLRLLAHAFGLCALGSPLFPRKVLQGHTSLWGLCRGQCQEGREAAIAAGIGGWGIGSQTFPFPSMGGFTWGLVMGPVSLMH